MTIERPDDPVIACTLTPSQAEGQLSAWAQLIDGAVSVTRADGHLRIVLPMTAGARAEELAARERACCAFLDISVIADHDRSTVTITIDAPTAAADEVVALIGRPRSPGTAG